MCVHTHTNNTRGLLSFLEWNRLLNQIMRDTQIIELEHPCYIILQTLPNYLTKPVYVHLYRSWLGFGHRIIKLTGNNIYTTIPRKYVCLYQPTL